MGNNNRNNNDKNSDKGSIDPRMANKPSRKPNRGKKPHNGKGKTNGDKQKGYDYSAPGSNELSWHVQSELLLKQSSDLSYANATGESLEYDYIDASTPTSHVTGAYRMPGIAVIRDSLALGTVDGGDRSPMTYAANTLMQEIRAHIRPQNSYDAPDVAMQCGAMAELYGGIAMAKRLVATANMYSTMNAYLPDMLFKAQKVDPTYLKENLSDFTAELNQIILAVNKVYVPNRMTLFNYIVEKYSNYYIEGPSIKDQIYFWTPALFRSIEHNSTSYYESCLQPILTFPYNGQTNISPTTCKTGTQDVPANVILTALWRMLSRVVNDTDCANISGDMQNAFGEGMRFVIPPITEDALAIPTANIEMLEMFQNARCCDAAQQWYFSYDYSTQIAEAVDDDKMQGWIVQKPTSNVIGTQTTFKISASTATLSGADGMDTILNMHEDPSPAKTMLLSRYANFVSYMYVGTNRSVATVQCAASLVHEIDFYKMTNATTMTGTNWTKTYPQSSFTVSMVSLTEPFQYRPMCALVNASGVVVDILLRADIVGVLRKFQQIQMNKIDMMTMLGAYDRF